MIATKFSGNLYPGDPNGGGSGRKSLINACENSLRRLQTDYIDLYWLHIWDANTPIDETMAALDDLVRAGKVRYLGVSDTPAWKIVEANLHRPLPRVVGLRRTADRVLAARTHRRAGTRADGHRVRARDHAVVSAQERCAQRQVHPGATPASTRLIAARWSMRFSTRRPTRSSTNSRSSPRRTRRTVASVALAWVHAQPAVTSIIVGARRISQFEDNVRAVDVNLTADEFGPARRPHRAEARASRRA